MQSLSAVFLPIALVTATAGAMTGYFLHARPTEPLVAGIATESKPRSDTPLAERERAAAWQQDPATMDFSWTRWPSLTDF